MKELVVYPPHGTHTLIQSPKKPKKDMTIYEDEGNVYVIHPALNNLRPDSKVETEVFVDEGLRQVTVVIDGKVFYLLNN